MISILPEEIPKDSGMVLRDMGKITSEIVKRTSLIMEYSWNYWW